MSKPLAQWRSLHRTNPALWVITVVVLMALVGAVFGLGAKALGSTPQPQTTSQRICTHNPDMTCAVTPKRAVRLFKAGHYTHAHGVRWKKVTTHPRRIRAVLLAKYEHYYRHASRAKKRHIREVYGIGSARTATSRGLFCGSGWSIFKCAGENMLSGLNRVSCASSDGYANTDPSSCVTITGILGMHHGNGLTKKQVQQSGTVGFCGTSSILMIQAASEAPSAPTAILAAGAGTGACLWTAWSIFDPGT